jgi:hypothetical protein
LTHGPEAIVREYTAPSPHHGVAVELPDGTLVVSEGTAEGRTGIRVLDAEGNEVASSAECPDLHGEAVSADEAVTFGCADGAIVYRDGAIIKASAPTPVGQASALSGTEGSAIALAEYLVPDAKAGEPSRVGLVDTVAGTERTVELPAPYGYWSLGRLEDGTGLVLGQDGALHVVDVEAATVTASYPVIDPWTEPEDWKAPTPKLFVLAGMAYVLDAGANALAVVDPVTGEVWQRTDLGVTPGEIAGVPGDGPGGHDHEDGEEGATTDGGEAPQEG